jgi:hypothetical protein
MAPAVQAGLSASGNKVNWLEYSRRVEQVSGWDTPDDIIIPQTDQDKQQAQASNPKVLEMQATQARLGQMHDNASKLSAQEHGQKLEQNSSAALDNASQVILTKSLEREQEKNETAELGPFAGGE